MTHQTFQGPVSQVAGRDIIADQSTAPRDVLLARRAALVSEYRSNRRRQILSPYLAWGIFGAGLCLYLLVTTSLLFSKPGLFFAFAVIGMVLPLTLQGIRVQRLLATNIEIASLVREIDNRLITIH